MEGLPGSSSGSRGYLRSGAVYRRANRGHYETLEALYAAHGRIFAGGGEPSFYLIERPISGRTTGLAEATLRLPHGLEPDEVREQLERAFAELFRLYGDDARFEVRCPFFCKCVRVFLPTKKNFRSP